MNLLQFSQHWQAADVFRVAPLAGPARLCRGARIAVLGLVVVPMTVAYSVLLYLVAPAPTTLLLLVPGLMSIPVFALLPNLRGRAVPLSQPPEEAKSAGRGLTMIGVMVASMIIAGSATIAWKLNLFGAFLLVETIIMAAAYVLLRRAVDRSAWRAQE